MDSAQAMTDLMVFFAQAVKRIFEAVGKLRREYDARSLELFVEQEMKALGALVLEAALCLRGKERTVPKSLPCQCGRVKHRIGRRPRTVRGILGQIELSQRWYYRCDSCGAQEFTGDELRGSSDFTQLAEERIVALGKEGAYGKARKLLRRLGLLEITGSTIRKVCVRLGRRLREQTDREAAEQYGAGAVRAEERPERLAIGVDGTMIGRIDVQHRQRRSRKTGRKVRGKGRLRHFFHEVKTLVIFTFNKQGEALRKTFHATQERVEQFREKVALEGLKRGAATARVLVFLGDGAAWVWKTAQELYPQAIQVLDWYHAVEHLWAVGRVRFGATGELLTAWVEQRKTELWDGDVDAVLRALGKVAAEMGTPDPALSEEARERDPRWIAHRSVGYFEENRQRMDYPRYRAAHLPIGSGVIESSCRHVVGDRLKRAGMRWDEEGADDLLALRCLDLNDRWDSLWPAKNAA